MRLHSPYSQDYVSPARDIGWFHRTFPALVFYRGLIGVVWSASRKARRGEYDDAAFLASSCRTVRLLESLGARLQIENVAAYARLDGPAVIIGNHMSTLETFVLSSILLPHRRLTFIIKRELLQVPFFKHVMVTRDPVVVGRANPREDLKVTLEQGEARLRAGTSIAVFPQKTRANTFTPAEFNSIGIKLAKRAGVPVVPLALRTDVWGIGSWSKDFGPIRPELPIHFKFGEPLTVTGSGRETHAAVVEFIKTNLRAWGVPILEAPADPATASD